MKNHDCPENVKHDPSTQQEFSVNSRRRFLQGAAVAAGGLVLGAQVIALADDAPATVTPADAAAEGQNEKQFPLPEKVLEEVGGYEVLENGDDKVIVARTGPTTIAACSAICTHKGGILQYDKENGQFFCTRHGARFEVTGKVAKGPAQRDLQVYKTRAVLGISPATETPE